MMPRCNRTRSPQEQSPEGPGAGPRATSTRGGGGGRGGGGWPLTGGGGGGGGGGSDALALTPPRATTAPRASSSRHTAAGAWPASGGHDPPASQRSRPPATGDHAGDNATPGTYGRGGVGGGNWGGGGLTRTPSNAPAPGTVGGRGGGGVTMNVTFHGGGAAGPGGLGGGGGWAGVMSSPSASETPTSSFASPAKRAFAGSTVITPTVGVSERCWATERGVIRRDSSVCVFRRLELEIV
jgi:hypothetical protein